MKNQSGNLKEENPHEWDISGDGAHKALRKYLDSKVLDPKE
jgi:hypothetical protein